MPDLKNKGSAFIAIWVIIAFTVFVAVVIAYAYFYNTLTIDVIEKIGAIFGPWVGTILGYYFGSRSAEPILQNNQDLRQSNNKLETQISDLKTRLRDLAVKQGTGLGIYIQELENQSKLSAPNLLGIIENLKRTKEELDRVVTQ